MAPNQLQLIWKCKIPSLVSIRTGNRELTRTICCFSSLLKENYKWFWCKISSDICSLPPWEVSIFISESNHYFLQGLCTSTKMCSYTIWEGENKKLLSYTKHILQTDTQNQWEIFQKSTEYKQTRRFLQKPRLVLQLPFFTPVYSLPVIVYSTATISGWLL